MFIELHTKNYDRLVTINVDMIQYIKQTDSVDNFTVIGVSNQNGNIFVAESYDRVKELIDNATRK